MAFANFSHLLHLAVDAPAGGGMGSGMIITLAVVAGIVVLLFAFVGMYNGLVAMRNRVKESWAQIEVQLKRRYDLIPNLVETVKGYAQHEQSTFVGVTEARNHALGALRGVSEMIAKTGGMPVASGAAGAGMPSPMGGGGPEKGNPMGILLEAEGILAGALKGMGITIERYPDLKANQNFLRLQEELTSTENKIAFARQHYNDEVRIYNTKRESIPTNMVAAIGGFQAAAFFEIHASERENVQVKFTS